MQINNKFRIFGIIVGVLMLGGLVGVMALTVQRAQQLQSTIGRPRADSCSAGGVSGWTCSTDQYGHCNCKPPVTTGSGGSGTGGAPRIEGCKYGWNTADGSKCGKNSYYEQEISITNSNGASIKKADALGKTHVFWGTGPDTDIEANNDYKVTIDNFPDFFHWPWHANVCIGKYICFSGGATYCTSDRDSATKTCAGDKSAPLVVKSNSVTVKIPADGATTQIGFEAGDQPLPNPNTYVCTDPINGKIVPSLTPTLAWNNNITGVSYQNVYVSETCGFDAATGQWFEHVPLNQKQVTVAPLKPNTTYYWNVYGNGANGIQGCGCPSFKTGAGTPTNTIPNCTNLTGPTTLTVGQAGTYSADYSSPQGNLGGTIDAGQNGQFIWNSANTGISGNSGHLSFAWTPTVAGTYDVFCRAWNDAVAECRGKANYVDAPPRYACAGPNSSMTVTVTAVASCVDSQCPDTQKCGSSNTCVDVVCVTAAPECKRNVIANHTCTVQNITDGTACGTTGSGNTCQSGVCTAPSCPSGQTLCSGVCKNLQTDSANCGACGTTCTSGQTCTSGACVTPAECTIDANCAADKKCVNNACISVVCPLTSPVCRKNVVSNHVCQSENLADNMACTDDSADSGITASGTCQTNGTTTSKCKCTASSTCATGKTCQLYSGKNFGECAIPQVTEVSVCWGNLGTGTNAGRCYDCNGDGVINILDFSCFAKRWREKVE